MELASLYHLIWEGEDVKDIDRPGNLLMLQTRPRSHEARPDFNPITQDPNDSRDPLEGDLSKCVPAQAPRNMRRTWHPCDASVPRNHGAIPIPTDQISNDAKHSLTFYEGDSSARD